MYHVAPEAREGIRVNLNGPFRSFELCALVADLGFYVGICV